MTREVSRVRTEPQGSQGQGAVRVLMAITAFRQEGPSSVWLNLMRAFDRDRIMPILGFTDADDQMLARLPADVEVVRIGRSGDRYPVRALAKAVKTTGADALLTTLRMNLTALAARPLLPRRVPILIRQANHSTAQHADLGGAGRLKKDAVVLSYALLGGRADLVVAQSEAMERDLRGSWMKRHPERVVRIPNPVDVEAICERAREPLPLGTVRGSPTFVAAGRLAHQKGFDILIEALARVVAGPAPSARLWLLGEGPDEPALRSAARHLGVAEQVAFLGFRRNPFPFFRAADIFVCSSRYEGLPNAALEAMACGTPVIATTGPGTAEEFVVPGRTGWLAAPGSVASLAAALCEGVAQLPDLPGGQLRDHVASRFGMLASARSYGDAVHQAVMGRAGGRLSSVTP